MINTKGSVIDIIYRSEITSYSIFKLETEDGDITVVGNTLDLEIGDFLRVSGEIVYHNDYGEQIKLNNYEKIMPNTVLEIERYLGSGIISQIKKKRAKQIVKAFGEDTLDIILNTPERLLEIKGIGKKSIKKIHDDLIKANESREISIYLQKFELGNKLAAKIYAKYRDRTIDVIENNPYTLVDEVKGIGFPTADKIAKIIGIATDSEFRIKSGIAYILNVSENKDGNCYLEYKKFIEKASRELKLNSQLIEDQITNLILENIIKMVEYNNEKIVYARKTYDSEKYISQKLIYLLEEKKIIANIDVDEEISFVEMTENIEYSETQKEAIKKSIMEKVLIITGGPGTGKTTIIKAIISILNNKRINFTLCAPTGRAAKRMEESTGYKASTIHRLLGYRSAEDEEIAIFINEENPIETDVLIIDEVSMVDLHLMENLLKALQNNTSIIFVGDKDQLPSVGVGNVLNDMIQSKIIPTIKLDVIFRQGEGSNIVKNAHLINNGNAPILNEENKDFFFINTRNDRETSEIIVDLVSNRLPKFYHVDSMEDIQVLTPTKRGICGVDNLNSMMQERLNPIEFNKSEIKQGNTIFRDGDKIMQIKNNYEIELKDNFLNKFVGVFNGDMGKIKATFPQNKSMEVDFDDKVAEYKSAEINELSLAYATTIHKSQGSEFPIVIIPMASAPHMLLTRNILYTGITRGKSAVILVGDIQIMNKMIGNTNFGKRNSTLDYYLIEGKNKYDQSIE